MSEPHQIAELKAENDRLKAEVERLTKENALATPRHLIASQDIKSLKSEVERLGKLEDYHHDLLNRYALDDMRLTAQVERLTAQVERLTKAGEALENWIAWECESPAGTAEGFRDAWNAAKEGKQP
jgi:hypothetical protein